MVESSKPLEAASCATGEGCSNFLLPASLWTPRLRHNGSHLHHQMPSVTTAQRRERNAIQIKHMHLT